MFSLSPPKKKKSVRSSIFRKRIGSDINIERPTYMDPPLPPPKMKTPFSSGVDLERWKVIDDPLGMSFPDETAEMVLLEVIN